jgi:zinc protease
VNARLRPAVGQRMYISSSPVQTDKTPEALQELAREYADVAGKRPITAAELRAVQTNETLGLPGSFESAAQLSNAYARLLQYKLPDNYYNTFTQTVMAMTPEQANALAAKSINPGQLMWVVVGDMSKVESGVRALNLGPVRKVDADGNTVQ